MVDFIKQDHNQPFFVYFSHHIAHTPILPSKPFRGKSPKNPRAPGKKQNPAYQDFLLELDDSVGRVRTAVNDAGIADNTLIVFLSDNGPARFGSAQPFSGGKYVTMEGGHRVPAIFCWPKHIPAGQVSDAIITSMDLLPLFCHVAGVEVPTDRTIDGRDISDLLTGKTNESPHDAFYYYNGLNLQAVRLGKWKLHLPRKISDQPYWAKRGSPKQKPLMSLDKDLLFDLETDPGEKTNVITQHPKVKAKLMALADRAREELGDVHVTGTDQRPHGLVNPNDKE